jgi:iron-sulfur cluster repair protein YtfE (RIC family)
MKATTLLTRQHNKALAALKKLASGKGTKEILDEVATELAAHMIIEETIFYPATREVKRDLVLEAYEEHAVAQLALKRLLDCRPGTEVFEARATTLRELIQHHVDEEQDELFPKVEKALDDEMLEELAEEMQVRFDELVAKTWRGLLPTSPGETTTDTTKALPPRAA